MKRNAVRFGLAGALIVVLLVPLAAWAHESVTAGDYEIEYGWLNEPPVAGQPNAIILNIREAETEGEDAHEDFADVEVSGLKVEVVYGPESKVLSLQPLGEDTPGQFTAPLTPTRAGEYTVRLTGQIGESDVNVEVQPEEVASADVVQFPSADAAADLTAQLEAANARAGTAQIVASVGAGLGLAGLGLGVYSLRKGK